MATQPLWTPDRTDATVRALTEDCLSMFSNCTSLVYYENQIALECMLAGLRLWADSVRATAEETVSLDRVYRSRPDDLVMIKHILIMLSDELNDYETHAENEQAAGEFIHGSEAAMNNLSMVGLAIRQSWKASRHQREPLPYDPAEFDDLRQHLELIILRRPSTNGIQSHVDSSKLSTVQRRLVDANLRRRHRFVLAQRASQALQDEPKLPPESPLSATTTQCPNNTQPSFSLYRPGDDGTQRTSSSLDPELPVMEKAALQRRFCKCPCCCQTIPCEEAKDLETWRQHLFEDLSPYTCFVEECPTPWVLFTTSQEWEEHVNADHPWQWECPLCEDVDLVYSERSDIVDHFQDKHEDELRNYTLPTLLSWSKVQRMGVSSCPLCDFKGFEDSTDIIAHVLCHVYDFSLRALPWAKTGSRSLEKPVGKLVLPNDEDARARLLGWLENIEGEPMEEPRASVFYEPASAGPANEASSSDDICYFEYNDYFEQNSVDNSLRPRVASSIAVSHNSEEGIGYEETFEGFDSQSAMLDGSQAKEIGPE
ncbi:hypothetical protein J3458_003797 [Metarhizium acridum]|uniref:uncharacterized protein n=1 Tax=Metarhizium acridum TaxID=92637 RepID=UPI001C6CC182|nr:hypothetical protein J3458_015334 [Metarhizium acridum]KAG8421960.1 hypothetical protein J3458_003789 [Metarhizium acridum]KAG8421968.1 hypothetical protein J3458_003797 [Metarhizium acridum]